MHPSVWLQLLCCVAAATLASAITAHNVGARANRLIALVFASTAWWALCEVLWNIQAEPDKVLWLVKASSPGWMLLGPLALDLFSEIEFDARSRLKRLVPVSYACAAASIMLYVATPWGLSHAVRTEWGWSYRFGPIFPVLYACTVGWLAVAMLNWRPLFSAAVAHERREATRAVICISIAATASTLTDVVLPYLDVPAPRLGSLSVLAMGGILALGVRRHGYFLIAPGAFAPEILATLRDGVALLRPDGSIRTCNEGLGRLVQLDTESLPGSPAARFLPELSELDPGAPLEDTELELWPEGGEPFPVSVSSSQLRDDEGADVGRVLAIRDLREITALRKRLVTSGRLAAVGELAASIAHEIANPITYVRANMVELHRHWDSLRMCAEKGPDDPALDRMLDEGNELLEESLHGVDRIAGIVRNVGNVSHIGDARAGSVDVNALLDDVLGVASLSFSVQVERCYGALPRILGYEQQLKQACLNLVLNAIQAVGDNGRIRLITQAEGDQVTIRVQDNGPGIPADAIERIFDPFFTTRPGRALGLGLAQCFQIVRAHGGEISAYSTPGRGSVFEVRVPVQATSPSNGELAADPAAGDGNAADGEVHATTTAPDPA
jgi:signal transduction histidine kinase